MTRGERDDQPNRRFLARYGAIILRGGIASIPTALYRYQGELGLKPNQVWFISAVLAHKWDADMPKPSLKRMAPRLGVTEQYLHQIKGELVKAGWLTIINRHNARGGQDTNYYDFGVLFGALEDLLRRDKPRPGDEDQSDDEDISDAGESMLDDNAPVENSPANFEGGLNYSLAPGLNRNLAGGLNRGLALKESVDQESPEEEPSIISNGAAPDSLHKIRQPLQRSALRKLNRLSSADAVPERLPAPEPAGFARVGNLLAQRHPLRTAPARREDSPGRGRPPKAPPYIEAVMADVSSRLHDEQPRSSLTLATRLWKASGLSEERFVHDVLYPARSRTQAQGNVKKRATDGYGTINRMPYFFAVVRDLLGMKDEATQ